MPLDLDPIKSFLEGEMSDACSIASDPTGVLDDTYDPETMTYTPPVGDVDVLYEGKCLILRDNNQPREIEEGGAYISLTFYRLRIPISEIDIPINSLVTVTESLRDPLLVGKSFYVIDEMRSSFAVSQLYLLRSRRAIVPGGGMIQP